jgi:hypothetical protein
MIPIFFIFYSYLSEAFCFPLDLVQACYQQGMFADPGIFDGLVRGDAILKLDFELNRSQVNLFSARHLLIVT